MSIDPEIAVGASLGVREFEWSASDVILYHLALGATELRYAFEPQLTVLPTFGIVAPTFHATEPPAVVFPGIDIDLASTLHGSQQITVHNPLPVNGKARACGRIADVYDKGSAAVIVTEYEVADPAGTPLYTMRGEIFARGHGGFGGQRGPSARTTAPDGPPDTELVTETLPQQALWYQLCGDRNPLHVDPEFAARAGFPRPILHGLCTYGMVYKSIVDYLGTAVPEFQARFAGVVFPGDTLRTKLWGGRFETYVDDRLVLTGAAGTPAAPA
ncbi:MaoC/PaaZ C-terminal domain-containing protein [Kutzneria sp. NPDC052558]|uniref:MaoC/PaaZ C-terminal domain-containing protein n=1 Tax=Kutzneria sp. NPDC052558 TaxID=3364121 RepID=UPI0037C874A1